MSYPQKNYPRIAITGTEKTQSLGLDLEFIPEGTITDNQAANVLATSAAKVQGLQQQVVALYGYQSTYTGEDEGLKGVTSGDVAFPGCRLVGEGIDGVWYHDQVPRLECPGCLHMGGDLRRDGNDSGCQWSQNAVEEPPFWPLAAGTQRMLGYDYRHAADWVGKAGGKSTPKPGGEHVRLQYVYPVPPYPPGQPDDEGQ